MREKTAVLPRRPWRFVLHTTAPFAYRCCEPYARGKAMADLPSRERDERAAEGSRVGALESTVNLLKRARSGDEAARDALVARYLPALRRFAHGRLPPRTRTVFDTDDLVQVSILRALKRLEEFDHQQPGSLLAYLRQIVINRIRDEARRQARLPRHDELSEHLPDPGPCPLERTIGHEALARYEAALATLPPESQEAVMMRLEMDCSYQEIAEALGRPSANAARMLTSRALLQLVKRLRDVQTAS